ncbi:MAG TPA: glycine zipper 2TM domain-containing protein [Caulobacteraceae bacterium]|nr:glycine zipper 2TM domain-containing protein [Caulobacteraceae bacterium]
MRKLMLMGSLLTALSLPLLAVPSAASASCSGRKTTGTVIGGVGGALLGNQIAHGGVGAIVGGLGGAVVGHEIGRSGGDCARRTTAYRAPARGQARTSDANRNADVASTRPVYRDAAGNLIR